MAMNGALRDKLSQFGTTAFSVISQRAAELGAINLGQGFPDYDIDPRLAELVYEAMRTGYNQYAPMPGLPALREQIAHKLRRSYGGAFDPEHEITVTLGATEAIFCAVQALVGAGEEAIILEPAYDSYAPAIQLAGAHCVRVPLQPPGFQLDTERLRAALTPRTRLLLLNSPNNPAGSVLSATDLDALAQLLQGRDIVVIADEVYEHLVYDGRHHHSVLAHAQLRERAVAVFSFGKTLHATGLRVGYAVAPAALTTRLRKVHQFNTFTIATSLQQALACYLAEKPDCGADLAAFFTAKRDLLASALQGSGFNLRPAAGTYFQLVDYSALGADTDSVFAARLLECAGVATIPLSVFYREPPPLRLLRLCFAKRDETLRQAAQQLRAYAHDPHLGEPA